MQNILHKPCLVCGDIFYKNVTHSKKYWATKKYCSQKCSIKMTSVHVLGNSNFIQKGNTPWNKDMKFSEEQKSKLNIDGLKVGQGLNKGKKFPERSGEKHPNWKQKILKQCFYCKKEILLPPHRISVNENKKYFCNRNCWALGSRQENSPVFKGEEATKPLRNRVMELPEYKKWHSDILKRDNYLCLHCGSRKNLEVDHIKSYKNIVIEYKVKTIIQAIVCEHLWDTTNGRTLCRECHRKTDNYGTKKTKLLT